MLKLLPPQVWAWDAEWCPDVPTIRRVHGLSAEMPDTEVLAHAYRAAGATAENPRPFLKTIFCRIVSIAAVKRVEQKGAVSLKLVSLPMLGEAALDEAALLELFLARAGTTKPQLVGFNSTSADLPALMQRAAVNRVTAPAFCARPAKPWLGSDYFAKYSDWHVDLMQIATCYTGGKSTPSLHELATAFGIPGKGDTCGNDVATLWAAGEIAQIIGYNQRDAVTTYLVWVRLALLAGLVTREQFDREQYQLATLLAASPVSELSSFLASWLEGPCPPPTTAPPPVGVPTGPPGKLADALDPPPKPARPARGNGTKTTTPAAVGAPEFDSRPELPF